MRGTLTAGPQVAFPPQVLCYVGCRRLMRTLSILLVLDSLAVREQSIVLTSSRCGQMIDTGVLASDSVSRLCEL